MITEEKAIDKTKRKHSKRLKYIDIAQIKLSSEIIFGKEYFKIYLPLNELGKKRTKSALPYISLIEKENGTFYHSRKKHLSQLIREKIFKIYLIPYLIIFLLISIGSYFSATFILLMYLIPILFGYMIFSITYREMGDYLKKISDFILAFTAAIGATLLIFQFIDIPKTPDNSAIYAISKFINNFQNPIKSIRVFLGEIFIFFYMIKLQISFSEMSSARSEYKKNNSSNTANHEKNHGKTNNRINKKIKNLIRRIERTPIFLTNLCIKIKNLF